MKNLFFLGSLVFVVIGCRVSEEDAKAVVGTYDRVLGTCGDASIEVRAAGRSMQIKGYNWHYGYEKPVPVFGYTDLTISPEGVSCGLYASQEASVSSRRLSVRCGNEIQIFTFADDKEGVSYFREDIKVDYPTLRSNGTCSAEYVKRKPKQENL